MKKMNREQAQVFEGIVSVVGNAILFGVKFTIGLSTGSVALMADAWHTASDSLTSIFVVVAAKLAAKKPDKEHPFGHGRWELIAAVLMASILAVIGYEFIDMSIQRLREPVEGFSFGTAALVITIVSIIVKELIAQVGFQMGKRYNNPVLTADGWHSRTDAISSVIVLIGIVISRFVSGLWWMDGVLGIFGALAIFYAAFEIMKETVTKILGEEPKQEFIDELNAAITQLYGNDLNLHHVHLHNYVTHKELTLHIRLDKDMTIKEGHDIATVIEDMVKEKFDMTTTIHTEPIKSLDKSEIKE